MDANGNRLKHRPASSFYFDPIWHPLQDAQTAADIDAYEWPILTDEELELLRREAIGIREGEGRDYAVIGVLNAALLEIAQDVRGWDTFMMDIVGEPELAERLLDNMLESYLTNIDRYFGAVGEYIDIIQVGGDLGTQKGPQMKPDIWYEMFQPRESPVLGPHQEGQARHQDLHAQLRRDLPADPRADRRRAGHPQPGPGQRRGHGPAPAQGGVRRSKLTFWGGGCETQKVLPFGTPEEVYENTSELIEIFKPGGGFVFCQVHNIQAQVPPPTSSRCTRPCTTTGSTEIGSPRPPPGTGRGRRLRGRPPRP